MCPEAGTTSARLTATTKSARAHDARARTARPGTTASRIGACAASPHVPIEGVADEVHRHTGSVETLRGSGGVPERGRQETAGDVVVEAEHRQVDESGGAGERRSTSTPRAKDPANRQERRHQEEPWMQPRQTGGAGASGDGQADGDVARCEEHVSAHEQDHQESGELGIELKCERRRRQGQHGSGRPQRRQRVGRQRVTQQADERHAAAAEHQQQHRVRHHERRRELALIARRTRREPAIEHVAGEEGERHARLVDLVDAAPPATHEPFLAAGTVPAEAARVRRKCREIRTGREEILADAAEQPGREACGAPARRSRAVPRSASWPRCQSRPLVPELAIPDVLRLIAVQLVREAQTRR